MTDLKALRREMAKKLDRDLNNGPKSLDLDPIKHIESALLRYAQACLRAEPTGQILVYATLPIKACARTYKAMCEQRAREIES